MKDLGSGVKREGDVKRQAAKPCCAEMERANSIVRVASHSTASLSHASGKSMWRIREQLYGDSYP
jgi:hypothetical protein